MGDKAMNTDTISRLAKTPLEKIVRVSVLQAMANAALLLENRLMLVELECGHMALTRAMHRMRCPRCQEMFRRSILDGSEDYDSVRNGALVDQMEWEDDPCRMYNERAA